MEGSDESGQRGGAWPRDDGKATCERETLVGVDAELRQCFFGDGPEQKLTAGGLGEEL